MSYIAYFLFLDLILDVLRQLLRCVIMMLNGWFHNEAFQAVYEANDMASQILTTAWHQIKGPLLHFSIHTLHL
jgi:hypothetical protein